MGKKKKHHSYIADEDKRFIHEVFDSAVRMVKEESNNPNAAKIYDFVDPILKRRKAATYNLWPKVQERYGSRYETNDLLSIWAKECSAMGHSVDGIDYMYHINLAAAIWMLDELSHRRLLEKACSYFTSDQKVLMSVDIPDMYDPCHEKVVLQGMVELLRERDPRDNIHQSHINDVSATRTTPVEHTAPLMDAEELSARERFNAVMAMIHPTVKERAVRRFEEKFWEFLDIYFDCDAPLYKEFSHYRKEMYSCAEECRALANAIDAAQAPSRTPRPVNLVMKPKAAAVPFELPSFGSHIGLGMSNRLAMDDTDRLHMLAHKGMECEERAEEVGHKRMSLALAAHVAQMMTYEEAVDSLGEEIAEKIRSLEVSDPYETCFAYMCLVEAGSDIPWTYNAAVAVLMAAARRLPWNVYAIEPKEDYEEYDDEDEDDFFIGDIEELPEEVKSEEPRQFEPVDWIDKKAELYRLKYRNNFLYAPSKELSQNLKVNLPQLIFGLTGFVMPRTVSDHDGIAEEFLEAGVEADLAKGLELYMQATWDIQLRSEDWRPAATLTNLPTIGETPSEAEIEADDGEGIEELKAKLKQLKEANDEYRDALYQAHRQLNKVKEEAAEIEAQAASERAELADLRELVFNQANNSDPEEIASCTKSESQFPYSTQKRVVVFGGHETWLKAIRPLLPNVTFINREQRPNADMIKAADVVWIQANALSHRSFYKIINVVRTNQVPIRYFGYASAVKCAVQVVQDDLQETDK